MIRFILEDLLANFRKESNMQEILWLILAILCLIYYLSICLVMKKWNSTFSRFWLMAAVLFMMVHITNYIWLKSLVLVIIGFFTGIELLILQAMSQREVPGLPYIIVLGAKVNGTVVSESLRRRLEAAVSYLQANADTKVIVSGSKLHDELITEAEAMKRYLVEHGIEPERILEEDQSFTTKQNLKFSRELMEDKGAAVGIVTSNYHMYRSLAYARRLGYQKVYGIPASCHPVLFVNYMTREFFAVFKIWLTTGFTML